MAETRSSAGARAVHGGAYQTLSYTKDELFYHHYKTSMGNNL